MMTVVMIVPTGIGCEIGGHCGDGNAPAHLLGGACARQPARRITCNALP
ncbi:MAG: DUF3326 domain-containing protein [Candidatus Marinimicrobia bacterium]|nr:DUF3326 domain-containing protein [Candidatus Neomarinimicrobiota bacterium]